MAEAQGFSLKDQLFNAKKVRHLAGLFAAADAGFDGLAFEADVMARLAEFELKERINWIADCLEKHLPGALPETAATLRAALPPPLDPSRTDDDFGDFIFAPLGEFVARAGLPDHPDLGLDLIEDITQRFSMEWAIRPYLNCYPDLVLERMTGWTTHESYHVRRLVSEGTRPRLPWGQAVGLDLDQPLTLLDVLHRDATRYVTRSVANHLNDITKKDPDMALDRLRAWVNEGAQTADELDWMTRHALRGLIKAGHPQAMTMLGYDPEADIECAIMVKPGPVVIDDVLAFKCHITAKTKTPVLVDYILWFRKADGGLRSKVFKLKTAVVQPEKPLEMAKSHRLKGNATTFRLFPGAHRVELQVNGRVRASAGFDLTKL
ncbi:MAG: 3-methyladenine DNA glycosylase AlkC [Paracoccaceae bacterium]|jgi:3-methyladenine DNA glycosylase AlkC